MIFPLYTISTNKKIISKGATPFINAGDNFNYFLIETLSGGYYDDFTFDGPGYDIFGERFIFTGSLATDSTNYSILCGAGIIEKEPRTIKDFKECYGLRGKYTLDALKKCKPKYDTSNIVLGDPGLLLSYLIRNYNKYPNNRYKYGLILHMVDKQYINDYFDNKLLKNVLIIDIETDNFFHLSEQIYQCEIIISSSLHGLIFANSFNKPTIYTNLIKKGKTGMPKDNVKFYDYYSIFSIDQALIENSIDYKLNNDNIIKLNVVKLDSKEVSNNQIRLLNNIINIFKKYNFKLSNRYSNNVFLSITNYETTYSVRNMCDLIKGDRAFQIGRIGGCECDVLNYILKYPIDFDSINLKIIPSLKTMKILDKILPNVCMNMMILNSGYYDKNNDYNILIKFMNNILSVIKNADIITIGCCIYTSEFIFYDNILSSFHIPITRGLGPVSNLVKNKIITNYNIIEDFFNFHHWFPCLDNKKILIISPFTKEIRKQLKNKDNIFTNNTFYNNNIKSMKYPNFQKVEYVTMPLTTNNFQTPHNNIIETDNVLCKNIKEKDFDICLLMAGAHTYVLQNYIRNSLNKSTIHLGGCGQLMFGIKGPRYETDYFTALMNENWIYPEQIVRSSYNEGTIMKADSLSAYFKTN